MPTVKHQNFDSASTVLGGQEPVCLDYATTSFLVTAVAEVVSGDASYSIEYTMDDIAGTPADSDPAAFHWLPLPDLPEGQTETKLVKIDYPVAGIRINIQSVTGELRFSVLQGYRT